MRDPMYASDEPVEIPEGIAALDLVAIVDAIEHTRERLGELPQLDERIAPLTDRLMLLSRHRAALNGTDQPITFTVTPEQALELEEQRALIRGPFGPQAIQAAAHEALGADHHKLHGTTDPVPPADTFWNDPDAASFIC
jgi:hypothetical protein